MRGAGLSGRRESSGGSWTSGAGPCSTCPGRPLPDPDTPAPVRFLPTWNAMLLVHARAKGVLAEARRPQIFKTKTPHSVSTFLVDGAVAGTWRYERGEVAVAPFAPLPAGVPDEVDAEAARVALMHP